MASPSAASIIAAGGAEDELKIGFVSDGNEVAPLVGGRDYIGRPKVDARIMYLEGWWIIFRRQSVVSNNDPMIGIGVTAHVVSNIGAQWRRTGG
jgi:hypothetical protein